LRGSSQTVEEAFGWRLVGSTEGGRDFFAEAGTKTPTAGV